ncbi:heparan-alpha-glucosaminide N-acetyltransferase-like [Cucumis melo var. makuwa]|uniref:Heparan-alpha-glucosaminide N-acetyltransferase-like n=1 Tax=Cucumis melo var. makuwa TaxID=1194695 RepID=A0A5D3BKQ6_CUCMM|nr:heparan-alpha-glucosaminide N-acetyltransferase-like [Cucumis melo var. makuwa]TYJ99539.1 heparan-alpha-glucosaminide N-acetyltransferase-like [Cucumis melo var. makuwa]
MTDSRPLLKNQQELPASSGKAPRVVSLDVFRGLSVFMMMLVDYGGSFLPIISHSPWIGLHLADFVMPWFLFIAGVSVALVYKEVKSKAAAARNAACRGLYLFLLGVLLQGGYFHGITSLTYGVDLERIRWLGILQRISIGYLIAALCEIWLTRSTREEAQHTKSFSWHWCIIFFLLSLYMALSYGLYVPDWDFKISAPSSSLPLSGSYVYKVNCSLRGDLGPACNSAGMIDRYVLGIHHLYTKPVYRNLKECNISSSGQFPETSPSWCRAPFEPEGLLSSLTATVACIIGLQYGHILAKAQDHKTRTNGWFLLSFKILALGLFLVFIGIPVNKSLYTVSYMLITSASAGIIFCALYILVDIHGYRRLTCVLEWMGKHSLSIYVLVISNILVIGLQGFYWKSPNNNIVHWIVSHVKARR